MLTEKPILVDSVQAAANLSKYYFVGIDGNVCGANAKARGVCQEDTRLGEQAPVGAIGIFIVKSGAAVTAGKHVTSDSSGRAVMCTNVSGSIASGATNVTSTSAQPSVTIAGAEMAQAVNGFALTAATAADQLILVQVR